MIGNERSVGSRRSVAGNRLGAWVLVFAALAAGAQILAPASRADEGAPAARAVRLSSVDGQVQISRGNQGATESSVANTPLFEGTTVTTADDGRAEIQFEDGSVARISPNSSLTLSVLRGSGAGAQAEVTLDSGLGYFELQDGGQAGVITVKFGDSVVTGSGFTVLRVSLDNLPGELAVFSGNAHLDRGGAAAVDLHGGESVTLSANDISRYTLNETIEPDSWDTWNSDRDQVLTSEAAAATGAAKDYGQAANPAWNDLDANGSWYNVPGEGNVWSPNEAANSGWDPYGNGSWMNSGAYGYTWVSAYPWGYMPYQCGAWNWYDSFGWGWAPGFGGCNPWWSVGGIYYGPNIGRGYGGYRPPIRPKSPKRQFGGGMIAVNRHIAAPEGPLPLRDRTTVVSIGGHTVLPMHPVSPRPVYGTGAVGFVNRGPVHGGQVIPATGGARPMAPGAPAYRAPAVARPAPRMAPSVSRAPAAAPSRAPSAAPSRAPSGGGGHH